MRPLLLPLLVLAGCTAPTTRAPSAPTPLPAATPAATAWLHPERRGSIIEATPPPAGVLFAGVALVDTAANRVFVTGSSGTLDALELSTGKSVFHATGTRGAIRRLGGGALAAIDAQSRLVLLDLDDGSLLFASAPTAIDPAYVTSVAVGKERLRVVWSRTLENRGGAYRPPAAMEGASTVALRGGEVTPEPTSSHVSERPAKLDGVGTFAGLEVTLEISGSSHEAGFTRTLGRVMVARRGDTVVWRHSVPPLVQDFAPYP